MFCRSESFRLQAAFQFMKKLLATALAASVTAISLHAEDALKETKDKVSYSIGLNIGSNLKHQGIEVNNDVLISGIKDALSGAKPKMTDEEMQATMQAFAS